MRPSEKSAYFLELFRSSVMAIKEMEHDREITDLVTAVQTVFNDYAIQLLYSNSNFRYGPLQFFKADKIC